MLGLGAMPALAIPEAEVIKKLEAVIVYVVVNAEGQPVFPFYHYVAVNAEGQPVFPFYQELDQLVFPMFMTAEQAQQEQKILEGQPGVEGSRVVATPLNSALERNERLREEIEARDDTNSLSLRTPLVPARVDWEKAEEILLAEGISQQEIAQNLMVPVFLTDPPISITPPGMEERRIALFFNYSQLQQAKQAVPDFEGVDKVIGLSQAINLLTQDEEDKYFFLPTEDTIKAIQAQQGVQEEESQEQDQSS